MNMISVESNIIPKPQTLVRGKKRVYPLVDPKKRAHVESYLQSGQTQRVYCVEQNLKLSSFKDWKMRYLTEQRSQRSSGSFKELIVTKNEKESKPMLGRIEIIKNDSKVVLCDIEDMGKLIGIIKGILSWS